MVDVIYADAYGHELGILPYCEGDFQIGRGNSFSLKVDPALGIDQGCYLMVDSAEFGGIVDGIDIDTSKDYMVASGRTWHGILETSIIAPDAGKSHLVVSGDANDVIGTVISRLGLSYCLAAAAPCGLQVSSYAFARYVDGYEGLRAMLRAAGAKLSISYEASLRKAVLSAKPRDSYLEDGIDGDTIKVKIGRKRPYNHFIGLGKGEGADRIVVNRYADRNGALHKTQKLFGSAYKATVYDSPNSDAGQLAEAVEKRLKEEQSKMFTCSLVDATSGKYDIDDIVGGTSTVHNVEIITTVAKKVCRLKGRNDTYETKTALEV